MQTNQCSRRCKKQKSVLPFLILKTQKIRDHSTEHKDLRKNKIRIKLYHERRIIKGLINFVIEFFIYKIKKDSKK